MELGNNRWPNTKLYATHSLKLHLIKKYLGLPQAESLPVNMPSIKYYKLETYTNSRFQISSYHDFEVTQMKHQVRSAASEAWSLCGIRLHPLLTQASTQNSRRLTGIPEALWHCFHFLGPLLASGTSAAQMWRGKRRGNHTDINRKSSWLQKEIVSHIKAFKSSVGCKKNCLPLIRLRPYKNHRDICSSEPLGSLGCEGRSNQEAGRITMTISDESHWSMSQRWLLLVHWHTPSLYSRNA